MTLTLSTFRSINEAIASRRQGYGEFVTSPYRCTCCGQPRAYWVSLDRIYICEVCGDN